MGNICSRSSNATDPFAQPGRPLGSSSTPGAGGASSAPRAPLPGKAKSNWKSPGRTLGGDSKDLSEAPGQGGHGGGEVDHDARMKAATAAQKRAESSTTGKGKLGSKLAAQKAKTQTQTLSEVSRTERDARDADEAARARNWE